jgi:ABC-type lipoprotein release transport system permease subunit
MTKVEKKKSGCKIEQAGPIFQDENMYRNVCVSMLTMVISVRADNFWSLLFLLAQFFYFAWKKEKPSLLREN